MSVTLQDILNITGDYSASVTGNINLTRQIRQINLAIEYFQRKAMLPNNEGIYSFYYNADQYFYPCPPDFMEEMSLLYNNPGYNTRAREWDFLEYSLLLKRTGQPALRNQWSFTTINGINQLVLLGSNIKSGFTMDSLDQIGYWVVQGDASALAVDNLDFKVGDGALSFSVAAVSTGLAGINNANVSVDLKTLFEQHGYVKVWTKFPSAAVDAVRLRLYTGSGNYWTITATTYDDGTAFAANIWSKIGWALDNVVKTGSPLITQPVIKVEMEVDLGAGFVAPGTFRFDQLYTTVPDYIDFIYRSNIKGTNVAGASLLNLTTGTDKLGIGELFPDIADLIAQKAAIKLWPQLRADKDFMASYQSDLKELMKDVGMRFPRKRTNKYLPTRLAR